jgi:hypothetical protein
MARSQGVISSAYKLERTQIKHSIETTSNFKLMKSKIRIFEKFLVVF